MNSDARQPLHYASARQSPALILWAQRPDGGWSITLPAPPAWHSTATLAVSLAFLTVLGVGGVVLFFMIIGRAGAAALLYSVRPLVCMGVAGVAMVSVLVHIIRMLLLAPAAARVPSSIDLSMNGLHVMTARSGRVQEYHFPAERITGLLVAPSTRTPTLKYAVMLVVYVGDTQTTFRFTTREPDVEARLSSIVHALRGSIGSAAMEYDPWVTPISL